MLKTAAFWIKKNVDLAPWETVLRLRPNIRTYAYSLYFFPERKWNSTVFRLLWTLLIVSVYLHSTLKFANPFFISLMIFPGKTNDVIYVLILYEEIEVGGGEGYQLPKISVLGKKLNYVAFGSSCSTVQDALGSQCLFHPFSSPCAAGAEQKIRGSLGTGAKRPLESSTMNSCLRPCPFPTVNLYIPRDLTGNPVYRERVYAKVLCKPSSSCITWSD